MSIVPLAPYWYQVEVFVDRIVSVIPNLPVLRAARPSPRAIVSPGTVLQCAGIYFHALNCVLGLAALRLLYGKTTALLPPSSRRYSPEPVHASLFPRL